MAAVINKENCTGCGECKTVCPCDAITIVDGLAIVNDDCAGCGVCVDVCPTSSITLD